MQRLNPRRAGPLLSIALQEHLYFAFEYPDRIHSQWRQPVQFTAPITEVELAAMHRAARVRAEFIERVHPFINRDHHQAPAAHAGQGRALDQLRHGAGGMPGRRVRRAFLRHRDKNLVFSTVGDPRAFERLMALREGQVRPALALSLHTTKPGLREQLLPRAARITPAELVAARSAYARATGYPIQYQWTLMQGVNDGDDEIDGIVQLLHGQYAVLNLIPYNSVPGLPWQRPSRERAKAARPRSSGAVRIRRWSLGALGTTGDGTQGTAQCGPQAAPPSTAKYRPADLGAGALALGGAALRLPRRAVHGGWAGAGRGTASGCRRHGGGCCRGSHRG